MNDTREIEMEELQDTDDKIKSDKNNSLNSEETQVQNTDKLAAASVDDTVIDFEFDNISISVGEKIKSSTRNSDSSKTASTEKQHDSTPSNHVVNTVHEAIFEFDLSDPITDPISVSGGETDEHYSDIETNKNTQSPEITVNDTQPSVEVSKDVPVSSEVSDNNLSADNNFIKDITFMPIDQNATKYDCLKNAEKLQPSASIPDKQIEDSSEDKPSTTNSNSIDNAAVSSINKTNVEVSEVLSSSEILPPSEFNDDCESTSSQSNERPYAQVSSDDEDDELNIEIGDVLHNLEKSSDKINQTVLEEQGLRVEVDISRENINLINSNQEFLRHQHTIMDNKCISFFWPSDGSSLIGNRISVSTEKEKTFIMDLDKIDIGLLEGIINSQRPIKVLHNAKPFIMWCMKNNFNPTYIFDITTAINLLTDGKNIDTSINSLLSRYSNIRMDSEHIDFQLFVMISKFIHGFRKKLVDSFLTLGTIDVLNFEQKVIFPIALAELNGMPYNKNPQTNSIQNILDLIESKYGVSSINELSSRIGLVSLCKSYISERKDLLEIREYIDAESSQRILNSFDESWVQDGRIKSSLQPVPAGGISTKDYSFCGEGVYSFISPASDNCLVEGTFKDLEVRIIAMLLKKSELLKSFNNDFGPYAYFAAPLFDKIQASVLPEEAFKAKMILEILTRNLCDRDTLSYAFNTCGVFMTENEILALKEKFKSVHPDLIKMIKKIERQAQKNKYVTTSSGRVSVVEHPSKAFYILVQLYMNDVFKRALELFYNDLYDYNRNYSPKITLCTIYNNIITLECDKKIVNIAIDMLTRNMTKAAVKLLSNMPASVKVFAAEQFEV